MRKLLAKTTQQLKAAKTAFVYRGIVREAADYARFSIIKRVVGAFLFQLLTVGLIALTVYAGSQNMEGARAVGLFAIAALIALPTDRNQQYFISWLIDDASYVY
jgi:hypothetical protein